MNIDVLRQVDRWVGVPLCRLVSLIPGSGAKPRGTIRVRRILVILLSEMGSLVLAEPMFRELRRRFPEAALYALLFEKNRELLELLDVMPQGNIVTIDDATAGGFLRGSLRAVRLMRRLGIDTVIDGELFTRVSSLFAYLSGARLRVGFHRHTQEGLYRGDFINRPVLYNPYQHFAHQLLTLADAVGSESRPAGKRVVPSGRPTVSPVAFGEQEIVAMKGRFSGDFPGVDLRKLVLLQPGGGALPIRAWPVEHYAHLSQSLSAAGYSLAIIGPPEDRVVARAIAGAAAEAGCLDLTGYTRTLRELLLLFHLAPLLIANDGGPAQFSALTPIPAVVLFGPETPFLYGSLNPRAVSVCRLYSCSPCISAYNHRKTPCDGDARCLREISPELVLGEALKLLRS
ncbi:MAG: glycosyltransferase family 9 protein [Candidatus Methylomirabilia bacterium]